MQCLYSFAVHISNEYCWIVMSGSYVLSSDCTAAVESCITLCGIHVEWTGMEADFFPRSLQFSLSMNPAVFHAHISLLPPVCGSTDQAAHYHLLNFKILAYTCWWYFVIHTLVFWFSINLCIGTGVSLSDICLTVHHWYE